MARPLLLALLLGVAGVAGVAACSDEQPSGPAVVAGAPAGSVTELHGSVTALRGAARRTLVAGDTVAGDDVIETGVDSRVTIVLMALALSILATLYPSWRASRLDPVEALRYE